MWVLSKVYLFILIVVKRCPLSYINIHFSFPIPISSSLFVFVLYEYNTLFHVSLVYIKLRNKLLVKFIYFLFICMMMHILLLDSCLKFEELFQVFFIRFYKLITLLYAFAVFRQTAFHSLVVPHNPTGTLFPNCPFIKCFSNSEIIQHDSEAPIPQPQSKASDSTRA